MCDKSGKKSGSLCQKPHAFPILHALPLNSNKDAFEALFALDVHLLETSEGLGGGGDWLWNFHGPGIF